jgi:NAD(P)-dependent dehydrogenase (short-subunit alcohol dehydrogenase family)
MAEGPLQGKVAMITGAASPIGLGHAMTVALVESREILGIMPPQAAPLP